MIAKRAVQTLKKAMIIWKLDLRVLFLSFVQLFLLTHREQAAEFFEIGQPKFHRATTGMLIVPATYLGEKETNSAWISA